MIEARDRLRLKKQTGMRPYTTITVKSEAVCLRQVYRDVEQGVLHREMAQTSAEPDHPASRGTDRCFSAPCQGFKGVE
jgi:hypothetical protein